MSDKKSIQLIMDDFSKKLSALNKAEKLMQSETESQDESKNTQANPKGFFFKKPESQFSTLQNQINERENERSLSLQKQMQGFFEPQTKDIEEDEEKLMKAYSLFCQIKEAHKALGDSRTHLKDFSIESPLCKKTEYTDKAKGKFAFLTLWFLATNPDSKLVPVMEEKSQKKTINITENSNAANSSCGFTLNFIEKELWKPSIFEKEIIQACSQRKEL